MRKTHPSPQMLVDRLEKKYQRKIRFQKYQALSKRFRQRLSAIAGVSANQLDEDSFDMFSFNDYEYTGR